MPRKEISNLVIENGRIVFRNFSGKETKFNPAGRRNFCAVIDDSELAQQLADDGWNIKYLKPRDEQEAPVPYIQVGVNYGAIPPKIYLVSGKNKTLLDEDTVGTLDWAEIISVDMTIRPYMWEVGGKTGIKAYIKNMYVNIQKDEFEDKYDFPDEDEDTPF